ncbi:GGDEF domain-containing protein [Catenuloplanes atrovinosus]|uniref:Diguanylate cyclase (GGDEF)-like protein n=1 Tax=Catenuloplanes atrovinosus TaxID=137266 RepID=A0AAE3YK03_9ACTN|nr:GGDEF domain-containing protein [Catenuloplanes atrovinosus]MDR7273865.1 diguanylate cyclase (GGDEF)-like protein [Catenuloplanes atrovinosus]
MNGKAGHGEGDAGSLQQRRVVELATLGVRVFGAVACLVTFSMITPGPAPHGLAQLTWVLLAVALIAVGCLLSLIALRHRGGRGYRVLSLAQIPIDLLSALVLVYGTSEDPRAGQMWAVLLVPIYAAAFRDDLRGAFVSGAAAIAGLLGTVLIHEPVWLSPGDGFSLIVIVTVLVCLTLLTGLPARGANKRIRAMQDVKAALSYQVHHDALTGLANRTRLHDFARQAMADRREMAVLALDLDGFKQVNDTLGHAAGDELLKVVAARLLAQARDDDIVARLGGDEFVIVLSGADAGVAAEVARRCMEAVAAPIQLQGTTVHVGTSIGFATTVGDGTVGVPGTASFGRRDFDGVLRAADAHMYTVKANRKQDPARTPPPPTPAETEAAAKRGRHRASPPEAARPR